MRVRRPVLTEQELEIMKIVWLRETTTVRDIYEELLKRRKIAYTTVMTMMRILEEKQYLERIPGHRAFVYRPAQPKTQVIANMVKEFVGRVFNGSAKPLMIHLVESEALTSDELNEIARAIKSKPRERRK